MWMYGHFWDWRHVLVVSTCCSVMRTRICIPASRSGGPQTPVTPTPRDLLPSSGFCGNTHACIHTFVQTHKHKRKQIKPIWPLWACETFSLDTYNRRDVLGQGDLMAQPWKATWCPFMSHSLEVSIHTCQDWRGQKTLWMW